MAGNYALNIRIGADVAGLKNGLKDAVKGIKVDFETLKNSNKSVNIEFDRLIKNASNSKKNIGELRKEIKEVSNISFKGLSTKEIEKVQTRLKELRTQLKELNGTSARPKVELPKETNTGGGLGNIKGAVVGGMAALGIADVTGDIIRLTSEYQKYQAVLTNSLGSQQMANDKLAMLKDYAATTPFQLTELTSAYVKLCNQGFVPTKAQMVLLGDLASSTGKSFDQLAEAVLDAQTGEFERLKEFGIKAKKSGDDVTFSFKGVETTVKNNASAIQNYILGLGKLDGVMGSNAAISATLGGKISNLKDQWEATLTTIGQGNSGVLSGAVGVLSSLLSNIDKVGIVVGTVTAAYLGYNAVVRTATTVTAAYNAVMAANPVGAIVVGIIALAGGIALLVNHFNKLTAVSRDTNKSLEEMDNSLNSSKDKINVQISSFNKLVAVARDHTKTIKERQAALDEIKTRDEVLFKNLNLNNIETDKATKLLNQYTTALYNAAMAKAYQNKMEALAQKKVELEEERQKAIRENKTTSVYHQVESNARGVGMVGYSTEEKTTTRQYGKDKKGNTIVIAESNNSTLRDIDKSLDMVNKGIVETGKNAEKYGPVIKDVVKTGSSSGTGKGKKEKTTKGNTIDSVSDQYYEEKQQLQNKLENGLISYQEYYDELLKLSENYYNRLGEYSDANKNKTFNDIKDTLKKAKDKATSDEIAIKTYVEADTKKADEEINKEFDKWKNYAKVNPIELTFNKKVQDELDNRALDKKDRRVQLAADYKEYRQKGGKAIKNDNTKDGNVGNEFFDNLEGQEDLLQNLIDLKNNYTATDGINDMAGAFGNLGNAMNNSAGAWLKYAANALSAMTSIMPVLTALFTKNQALSFSEAISGAMKMPWPLSLVALGANVAAVVAAFAAVPKFASGGIVPGSSYAGDTTMIAANAGERILTTGQQGTLDRVLSSGTSVSNGNQQLYCDIHGDTIRFILDKSDKKRQSYRRF